MSLLSARKEFNLFFRKHKLRARSGKRLTCPPLGTIHRWAFEELITKPTGQEWAEWVWAEIAAAVFLMESVGLTRAQIRQGRSRMVACMGGPDANNRVKHELARLQKEDPDQYSHARLWIFSVLKILNGSRPDEAAWFVEKKRPGGVRYWQILSERKIKQLLGPDAPAVDNMVREEEIERLSV